MVPVLLEYQYLHVKSWLNVSNSVSGGELAVFTDNTFYAKSLTPGSSNVTLQYCLFIVSSGDDPDSEIKNPDSKYPRPSFFYFDENAPPVSNLSASIMTRSSSVQSGNTATPSSTIAASPTMVSSALATSGTNNNGKLAPWMIAVIAAAGVAVTVACIAAIIAVRATKKGKYDKKVYSAEPMIIAPNSKGAPGAPGPSLYDSRDISSIHSTTPIINGHQRSPTNEGNVSIFSAVTGRGTIRQDSGGNRSTYSPSLSPSNSPQQPHTQLIAPAFATSENPPIPTINEPRSSTSVLTSNDAMLIADTFRQFMRKPDWQEQELNDLSSPSTSGNDEDEEERRRRLGDELLRKELAEEGTPMQRVQRKATHVNVLDAEKQVPLDGVTEKLDVVTEKLDGVTEKE
ncbi:hypothetical protein BC937DRAFT_94485 [Endogone sp. FLAS-F59071]|nr:hypothetical protein BC937DRAFT_94485 [Endogone sp. FLAS-F59071]|eukprot:RUS14005.1 hypothetical protein BC937DRAFT_94485 [Endogone sp. FLAS-F59071]